DPGGDPPLFLACHTKREAHNPPLSLICCTIKNVCNKRKMRRHCTLTRASLALVFFLSFFLTLSLLSFFSLTNSLQNLRGVWNPHFLLFPHQLPPLLPPF